jgi:hypothetical protein
LTGKTSRRWIGKWIYAPAALSSAVLLTAVLMHKPDHPTRTEINPAAHIAPTPPQSAIAPSQEFKPAPPVAPKTPAPSTQGGSGFANRSARPVWRVIVYTYGGPQDARRKVQEINAKWADFQAEVFPVSGDKTGYLVAIGGAMTREDALRMRLKALAAGLPQDTYVQNYSH